MRRLIFAVPVLLIVAVIIAEEKSEEEIVPLDAAAFANLVQCAATVDSPAGEQAASALREAGATGLAAMLETPAALRNPAVFNRRLDQVAGQYRAQNSGLYWYTDFEQARDAARKSGKPILSLRLLGKLTDEFSCANSRFFRATLYSNAEISRLLGERFVLHWKSVRPVPKVTIDFGDGRKLERTLTGNSIHYVLDSDGQVIDALPGLYGPAAFRRGLEEALRAIAESRAHEDWMRDACFNSYYRQRLDDVTHAFAADLTRIGVQNAEAVLAGAPLDQDAWKQIATLHASDARLDEQSRRVIGEQFPNAPAASAVAVTKTVVEFPLLRVVAQLEENIGLDTVRNEYLFHRAIYRWLLTGGRPEVDKLNERVYAELFLTPMSDPWLGLSSAGAYAALEQNGQVTAAK